METAHMEHVLDHTKPDFMDTASPNYFDHPALSGLDYLQYPTDGFDINSECMSLSAWLRISLTRACFPSLQWLARPPRAWAASTLSTSLTEA